MRDNTRRNRNIGTAKQGHGQNNRLQIACPNFHNDERSFYERLGQYEKYVRAASGYEFTFVVETPREDCYYPCSIEDVAFMLSHIPQEDYGNLRLVIFRQPKRKEQILSSVWGRFVYRYHFEKRRGPAIVLDAVKNHSTLTWPKKLLLNDRHELERLQDDGHMFIPDKRSFQVQLTPESARATQLYRTLLHEWGHYVHYLKSVVQPLDYSTTQEVRERNYFSTISSEEKERFAHAYADRLLAELRAKGIVPFPPITSEKHPWKNQEAY